MVNILGLAPEYMDRLTIGEVGYLVSEKTKLDKLHYTLMARAVSVGYNNATNKKQVKMFEENKSNQPKQRVGTIDSGRKQSDLDYLRNM